MNSCTHTHTHANTHTHTHTNTQTRALIYSYLHAHTSTHPYSRAHMVGSRPRTSCCPFRIALTWTMSMHGGITNAAVHACMQPLECVFLCTTGGTCPRVPARVCVCVCGGGGDWAGTHMHVNVYAEENTHEGLREGQRGLCIGVCVCV